MHCAGPWVAHKHDAINIIFCYEYQLQMTENNDVPNDDELKFNSSSCILSSCVIW